MLARRWLFPILFPVCSVIGSAQTSTTATPDSIKDPKQLLAAVAQHYDFANPALKPWHFKASYQIFDKDGNPGERGAYEYWWASPTVFRSTWTRGSARFSAWHRADGKRLESASGGVLHVFEKEFPEHLLEPLPTPKELDPQETWMERATVSFGKTKAPCIKLVDRPALRRYPPFPYENPKAGVFATYCFDPNLPVLVYKSQEVGTVDSFGSFVKIQGRDLAESLLERVNQRNLLSATVDQVGGIAADDPALTPDPDANEPTSLPVLLKSREMSLRRLRGPAPEYPVDAKRTRLSGMVMMEATIGKDGKVRDLEVESSPGQALTDAAADAVRKWEYQPYLVNGSPVEVRTEIDVVYSLSP